MLATVTRALPANWRLTVDVAPRWESGASDYSKTALRAQVARLLADRVTVGAGYEFQEPAARFNRREHRLWQQVQVAQQLGALGLSHRARFEQRWLDNAATTVLRARYQLRASRRLAPDSPWSWLAFEESLVTVRGSRRGPRQGLDRQRFGGGLARAITPRLTVEGGYMWQFVNLPAPLADQVDHVAQTALLYRF